MLITILIFLGVLGLLILAHEFGHFLAAKKFKMHVEEFGFFYPPRLWKFRKGETTYSLNLIPVGGYVKIQGEDGEKRGEAASFGAKPAWQRAVTLAAGVGMNFVLAFLIIAIGYMVGLPSVVEQDTQGKIRDPKIQIVEVAENSPAHAVGLEVGDTIIRVNGEPVTETQEVIQAIEANRGQETIFEIERSREIITAKAVPRLEPPSGEGPMGIGLTKTAIVSYPVARALAEGFLDTLYAVKLITFALGKIIADAVVTGKVSPDLSGPVGVAVMTGRVARLGFVYVLQFTAILSINLMIVNILPLPALDGGRLLFLAIESIRRRPLNQKIEQWANTVGFALVIGLLVLVTFRDVFRFGVVEKISALFS